MLWTVLTWLRRVAVVVLATGLVAGAWRPCAGWKPTAEARMSCCIRNGACSMHKPSGNAAHAVHTQSDADACCAISDRQESQQPSFTVVLPPALAPLAGVFAEAPSVPIRWVDSHRPPPLLASRDLPRHLLLSVFVI
jgi:hypothetical protein